MHGREYIDSYESGLGRCTLPEVTSIWYIDLEPVCATQEFIQMARLIVQVCNNEDTPTTCVRLCTSIENVEMLQHQENDERCRDGQGISRVSPEQLRVLLQCHL